MTPPTQQSALNHCWHTDRSGNATLVVNGFAIAEIIKTQDVSHPYTIQVIGSAFENIFTPIANIDCKELQYAKDIVETTFREWMTKTISIFI